MYIHFHFHFYDVSESYDCMNESRSIKNSTTVNNRKVVMDENTKRSIFKEWKEK